jgi:hypothetical protein
MSSVTESPVKDNPKEILILENTINGVVFAQFRRVLDAMLGDDEHQRRIAIKGLDWLDLILRKNADYGSSVFKVPVLCPTLSPGDAILVRASDKIQRLQRLLSGVESEVKSETITETLGDLGSYVLLYLVRPGAESAVVV